MHAIQNGCITCIAGVVGDMYGLHGINTEWDQGARWASVDSCGEVIIFLHR